MKNNDLSRAFILCLGLYLNFIGPVEAGKCKDKLNNLLSRDKSKLTYITKNFPVPSKVLSIASDNRIDKNKIFFILLPGNSGRLDSNTNHNLGYDTFESLIEKFKLKGADNSNYEVTENVLIRDGDEFWEEQTFKSEKLTYRTDEGQMFYRYFPKSGKTLVLLRSTTNYNQGSSYFFMPVIEQMGGHAKNIIIIHDDLKLLKGSIQTNVRKEIKPNGNNSLKDLQFNLYASKILSFMSKKIEDIKMFSSEDHIRLLRNIRLALIDNRFDRKGTSEKVLKIFKSEINDIATSKSKFLKSHMGQIFSELGKAKGMWARERDPVKKISLKELLEKIELKLELSFPKEASELEELSLFNKNLKTYLKSFDKELKAYIEQVPLFEKYSEIKLGTGYNEWLSSETLSLTRNPYDHEIGSLSHFVLSPYDQTYFNKSYFDKVTQKVEELILILD